MVYVLPQIFLNSFYIFLVVNVQITTWQEGYKGRTASQEGWETNVLCRKVGRELGEGGPCKSIRSRDRYATQL